MSNYDEALKSVIAKYRDSFSEKEYNEESDEHDLLMDVFGISPQLKRENRQYWGRELGMCWQLLLMELFQSTTKEYGPGFRIGADELCDLIAGKDAIDTKYRVGSGDSGTLKKFKQYGPKLADAGYRPVMLFLRSDNLPAAITAIKQGGWSIYSGPEAYRYIFEKTNVDLETWFKSLGSAYAVSRARTPN